MGALEAGGPGGSRDSLDLSEEDGLRWPVAGGRGPRRVPPWPHREGAADTHRLRSGPAPTSARSSGRGLTVVLNAEPITPRSGCEGEEGGVSPGDAPPEGQGPLAADLRLAATGFQDGLVVRGTGGHDSERLRVLRGHPAARAELGLVQQAPDTSGSSGQGFLPPSEPCAAPSPSRPGPGGEGGERLPLLPGLPPALGALWQRRGSSRAPADQAWGPTRTSKPGTGPGFRPPGGVPASEGREGPGGSLRLCGRPGPAQAGKAG